jgi:hypothetical protein
MDMAAPGSPHAVTVSPPSLGISEGFYSREKKGLLVLSLEASPPNLLRPPLSPMDLMELAAAAQPMAMPIQRFSHVRVDLVGPLLVSADGYAYLLMAIDRSTRWAEAMLLKVTSASDCPEAFIASWMSLFGVPATLTPD